LRCPYVPETTLWREAIHRQQQFCTELGLHGDNAPIKVQIDNQNTLVRVDNVQGGSHSIYVMEGGDVVSKSFRENKHWERRCVAAVVDQLIAVANKKDLPRSEVVFIDIGANLGTFSVAVAAAGFKVFAFEPMETNIAAIRYSLCANKHFINNVALIETGLGKEYQTCGLFSGNDNVGDGFVSCDANFDISLRNISKRQDLIVRRLDDLLDDSVIDSLKTRVAALKIDVEGFEPLVFEGAKKFLDVVHPEYLMTEVNTNNPDKVKAYLEYMSSWYEVHENAFNGPILDLSTLKSPSQGGRKFEISPFNLYLVAKPV
jgi:FkbM family methyltransferase